MRRIYQVMPGDWCVSKSWHVISTAAYNGPRKLDH
jgi:hypothetical protein